ncbi:MAG: LacI family DNA-binding transcriptional regulator [Lachnospiraceae bacterium]|nr:LacI family DNA-binding transcriptional regulator [Lachnospiraceae bacterium]
MVTIKDVARECGVSVATVSNILNGKGKSSNETASKIRKKAKEMGYVPNSAAIQLKTKKTRSLGVIVEDMTIFSIPDVVDGITNYCDKMNYQIELINLRLFKNHNDTYYYKDFYYKRIRDEVMKFAQRQMEGIIYVSAHERVLPCFQFDPQIPMVMAYSYSEDERIPSVVVDDVNGSYEVVKHLISMGHSKIGVITGKPDSMHAQARLLGYQKAMYDSHNIFVPEYILNGDWGRASGYEMSGKLLKSGVTAIYCMNDLMAGGVYDRIYEEGLTVGKDISVAGYDGRELATYYKPPLTTMTLPLHDIGYEASRIMIEMLENDGKYTGKDAVIQVPCQFMEGKSIARI